MLSLLAVAGAGEAPVPEAAKDARGHLEVLTDLGPRPSGSAANTFAAQYLVDVLSGAGYQVEIQEGMVQSQGRGHQGRVRNVVAWLPVSDSGGPQRSQGDRQAVLFASHYDSVADGPGAADDAISVAALLSVATDLPELRRSRPALFLFTDGEERGLLGAQLFVAEHPLAPRVGAVFNFDHSGRQPPLYAFETAAPNRDLLRSLAGVERGSRPRAFSFASDLYRVLPFGTDFTVFRHLEVPGVNFALIRDGYVYHTPWDRPEGVAPEALEALVHVVRQLAEDFVVSGLPLDDGGEAVLFFPVGPWTVRLGPLAAAFLAWGAVLAGVILLGALARGPGSEAGRGILATLFALPLAVALIAAAEAILQGLTGRSQVAYAQPWPWFALLILVGFLSLPLAQALVEGVRGRHRAVTEPAGPAGKAGFQPVPRRAPRLGRLAGALTLWTVAGALTALAAPSSSAFFSVPLLGLATVAALEVRGAPGWLRVGAGLFALALAAVVWVEPIGALVPFLVTTLALTGPQPLLLWPAVAAVIALFLGSLLWALVRWPAGPASRPIAWHWPAWAAAVAGAVVLAAVVVWGQPYSREHPQRVWAYHVTTSDGAYWALVSADPVAGVTPGERRDRESPELWWLSRRWDREIFDAEPAEPPRVQASRSSEGLELEILPPLGADTVTLFVEGMEIESTEPPIEPDRLGGPRVGLRQIVADGSHAHFQVGGVTTQETELLVVSSTVGLPSEPPFADRLGAAVAVAARTLSYVEVPVPEQTEPSMPVEEVGREEAADGMGPQETGAEVKG